MRKLQKNDPIFDGFAHRGFYEAIDGWRNELPDAGDYPGVLAARDTLYLFNELCAARKRIWTLEQRLAHYEKV